MNRLRMLVVALAVTGTALIAGAADPKPTEDKKPTAQRVAVFNMAEVMRDFHQVKHHNHLMSKKKEALSKQLAAYRDEYLKIVDQSKVPNRPRAAPEDAEKMRDLVRKIEAEDDKVGKQLKKETDAANSDFHRKIKTVVEKTAEVNGYQLVFAYSDTGTPDDLKLKPPAVLPFYVDSSADITAVVTKTLNLWYPVVDKETGDVLDYSVDPPKRVPTPSRTPLPPK